MFTLSFTRVYIKIFIDFIKKREIKEKEIKEIISVIKGKQNNVFRDMLNIFIYKIIYNNNGKDINIFKKVKDKYFLDSNINFLESTINKPESLKNILFIEAYKIDDKDFFIQKLSKFHWNKQDKGKGNCLTLIYKDL